MRTIYIDDSFTCHSDYVEGRTAVQTTVLDNVCDEALRFYIYVPVGSTCTMPNGITVKGEFIQCFDSRAADLLQAQYEAHLAAMTAAYESGVNSI